MGCMELKICTGDKHHRHTDFCQNLRGDPKFIVDLTWNDPNMIPYFVYFIIQYDSAVYSMFTLS